MKNQIFLYSFVALALVLTINVSFVFADHPKKFFSETVKENQKKKQEYEKLQKEKVEESKRTSELDNKKEDKKKLIEMLFQEFAEKQEELAQKERKAEIIAKADTIKEKLKETLTAADKAFKRAEELREAAAKLPGGEPINKAQEKEEQEIFEKQIRALWPSDAKPTTVEEAEAAAREIINKQKKANGLLTKEQIRSDDEEDVLKKLVAAAKDKQKPPILVVSRTATNKPLPLSDPAYAHVKIFLNSRSLNGKYSSDIRIYREENTLIIVDNQNNKTVKIPDVSRIDFSRSEGMKKYNEILEQLKR